MQINLKVKAVIFDMDGVITNTMPDHFRAWKGTLQKANIHVNHYEIYKREGQQGMTSLKEIFKEHHVPFDERLARKLLLEKEKLFKKTVRARFIPGSRKFLRLLHRRHFKLAIVTGTSRHEMQQILPDYLYKLFAVTITGTDVKNGKPSPEPFRKALKKLGFKASQAVVIENAPFGIQAAKGAGLKCFAVATSLSQEYLKGADKVFQSIKNLSEQVNFIANFSSHEKQI